MEIIILKNKKEVAEKVVDIVGKQINKKPTTVLGLASGNTVIPIYKKLIDKNKKKQISFKKVRTFALDEFYGISFKNKKSWTYSIMKNFLEKTDIAPKNIFYLDGGSKNYKKICKDYEKKIKKIGGIDLQILGIGTNGHIGYNEPGSLFRSKTRKVKLTESTRKARAEDFGSLNRVPKYALTMGISTIMQAKKIIFVATGKHKAEIVKKFLKGKITTELPASVIKRHKNATVVFDEDAAFYR